MSTSLPSASNSSATPDHDEIAPYACELWLEAGQPEARDAEFWLEAERRLLAARPASNSSAVIFATLAQPVTRRQKETEVRPLQARRSR